MAGDNIDNVITGGIVFHGSKRGGNKKDDGFHTKAKKKGYVTGSHGSASAKKKADIRRNPHSAQNLLNEDFFIACLRNIFANRPRLSKLNHTSSIEIVRR